MTLKLDLSFNTDIPPVFDASEYGKDFITNKGFEGWAIETSDTDLRNVDIYLGTFAIPRWVKTTCKFGQNDSRSPLEKRVDYYKVVYKMRIPPYNGPDCPPGGFEGEMSRGVVAELNWIGETNHTNLPNIKWHCQHNMFIIPYERMVAFAEFSDSQGKQVNHDVIPEFNQGIISKNDWLQFGGFPLMVNAFTNKAKLAEQFYASIDPTAEVWRFDPNNESNKHRVR